MTRPKRLFLPLQSRPVCGRPCICKPVFRGCRVVGGAVSEELFAGGLCLPSGTAMTQGDLVRAVEAVRRQRG